MVKLKDIAARAGVSIMTVSKALRDARDISAETRVRIRKLAQEMGYVPDLSAQLMRSRKTKLFGLIISAATNPIYARIMMALEERAYELGYDLIFAHSLNQTSREEACIRRFLLRRVDGLFIVPVNRLPPNAPAYEEIRRLNVPTIILGHRGMFF